MNGSVSWRAGLLGLWLICGSALAGPTDGLQARLQAWQAAQLSGALAEPGHQRDYVERHIAPLFDFSAMLAWAAGPALAQWPAPLRARREAELQAFVLEALARSWLTRAPVTWQGRLQARLGNRALLLMRAGFPDGERRELAFALQREPKGWRIVALAIDGRDVARLWPVWRQTAFPGGRIP